MKWIFEPFVIIWRIVQHPLNRHQKIKAIARFLKWQIASRIMASDFVIPWIGSVRFFARKSERGVTVNIYNGLHEFEDMAYVLHALRQNDLFVDIGANAGSYSLLAGGVCGARCVAFEPVPSTYARLLENIRLNRLENKVRCLNVALGDKKGTVSFTSGLDTTNHVLADGETCRGLIEVGVDTLDSAIGQENPFMIKMDVEGFEWHILRGAASVLKKSSLSSLLVEVNSGVARYGLVAEQILKIMEINGFYPYKYDPAKRLLARREGEKYDQGNILFIRDIDVILDRVKSAPRFCIHDTYL